MKFYKLFISIILSITSLCVAATEKNACGDGLKVQPRDKINTSIVSFGEIDNKYFYYFLNDYVIFSNRKDFIENLKKNIDHKNYSILLDKLTSDELLDQYVDLRKYNFENVYLDLVTKHVLMSLIESGRVKILDLRYSNGEKGKHLQSASIVRVEGGGIWRLACDTGKHLILDVNDEVE